MIGADSPLLANLTETTSCARTFLPVGMTKLVLAILDIVMGTSILEYCQAIPLSIARIYYTYMQKHLDSVKQETQALVQVPRSIVQRHQITEDYIYTPSCKQHVWRLWAYGIMTDPSGRKLLLMECTKCHAFRTIEEQVKETEIVAP